MPNSTTKPSRIIIFDLIRGWAIIQVLLYHLSLFFLDKKIITKADGFKENILRFGNPLNYFLASGYQGVHLFLIISGFLLTLSCYHKQSPVLTFYKKRLKRILIPYYPVWLICLGLIVLSTNLPFLQNFSKPVSLAVLIKTLLFPFYFDFDSSLLSQINRAWWFLPLILELYLIFPLLLKLAKKVSLTTFSILIFLITFHYRLMASFYLQGSPIGVVYQSLGGSSPFILFPARLFEFSLGICLGLLYLKNKNVLNKLNSLPSLILGLILQFIGTVFSFYQSTWSLSDPVISLGVLLISINLCFWLAKVKPLKNLLLFLGNLSYPIYLIHYLLLTSFLVPFLSLNMGKIIYLSLLPIYFITLIIMAKIVQAIDNKF